MPSVQIIKLKLDTDDFPVAEDEPPFDDSEAEFIADALADINSWETSFVGQTFNCIGDVSDDDVVDFISGITGWLVSSVEYKIVPDLVDNTNVVIGQYPTYPNVKQ